MTNQPPIEKMSPRALLAWRVGAVAVAVAFLAFIIVALATNGDANTSTNVADTNTVTPISTPQWDMSASDTNEQKLAYDLALKGLPMLTVDKYLAVQPVNQNELSRTERLAVSHALLSKTT